MDVEPIHEVYLQNGSAEVAAPFVSLLLQSLDEAAHHALHGLKIRHQPFSILQTDRFVRRRGQSLQSTTLKVPILVKVVCGVDCDLRQTKTVIPKKCTNRKLECKS